MLTRRDLLSGVGASVALGTVAAGCGGDGDPAPASIEVDFIHGVASGDPMPDKVILWTRVTPRAGASGTAVVRWEVSRTLDFAALVASGTFSTTAERDYTVKVDAGGLPAGTTLYYRFSVNATRSPVGRTRTAASGTLDRLRLALVSCSSYAHGYFHVYRDVAEIADLDAVVHLGDYIYEFQNFLYGNVRTYDPPEAVYTLAGYRRRHAYYKRDADVRALHQQHPMIAVWDDHEFANNTWMTGADNHSEEFEGAWAARKAAAQKAYFEWMPVREQANGAIWRKLSFGNLVDLMMLDTRVWARSMQMVEPVVNDAQRTLLGNDQEQWLLNAVMTSSARWKLLGQQVAMGPIHPYPNPDAWEGYATARTRFLQALTTMRASNVAVLTGDIHSSWAMDIAIDPFTASAYDPATGRGSLGVEFITPAVTSPGDEPDAVAATIVAQNPHMRYAEPGLRGYVLLDCTPERVHGSWYHLAAGSIEQRERRRTTFSSAWMTLNDANHLVAGGDAPAPRANAAALVPFEPA